MMNKVSLSQHLRSGILSLVLGAAALGAASAAFAGEETSWYDKWPDIQAQLDSRPAQTPQIAQYPAPAQRRDGGVIESPSPPLFGRGARFVDPPAPSPYDVPRFNYNPG